ncbi:MAG: helix-turn-helix domain-containing protein [Spirochaetaceae bacterium]|jgi:hypothetical protein|nr:helix-turn-helix domain-containing protein [Spirochaetaceae bacterium]
MEEKKIMSTAEVAELTGYKPVTVRKYALILRIPYSGIGRRKIYKWSEDDIIRFRQAIISPDGRRDRRGKPRKVIKNKGVITDSLCTEADR